MQEYQMRGVAYTGNNMRKRQMEYSEYLKPVKFEMKPVYHKYSEKKKERKLLYEKRAFSAVPKAR